MQESCFVGKRLKHQNIIHTKSAFFSFRCTRMNPQVIVVRKCVFIQFADVLG